MEFSTVRKKSIAAIVLLTVSLLSAIALSNDASAKAYRVSQRSHILAKKTAYPKQVNVKRSCAKVIAENTSGENVVYKLNVRSRIYGPVIEQLDHDTTVTVIRRFPNGWVQISSPVQGFVFGEFLKGC